MKWRNSKERELLSSGGNRDATIPSKENPHPDLTDTPGVMTSKNNNQQMDLTPGSQSNLLDYSSHQQMDRSFDDDEDDDIMEDEMSYHSHLESFGGEHGEPRSDSEDEEINVS